MSKSNGYTEEFKIEAVKQVTERNYPVAEVAERLGASGHSIYSRINAMPRLCQNMRKQAHTKMKFGN